MSKPRPASPKFLPAWLRQEERGSTLGITVAVWLALRLGRRVARTLLPFACAYFLVFAQAARTASTRYLGRALGRPASRRDVFRHFHAFASCVLDRVFFLAGKVDEFEITVHGEALLENAIAANQGGILLGAHLGSFEVLRSLGRGRGAQRVKMLMFEDNARKITAVLNAISPALAADVISLGRPDSFITVQGCLQNGCLVGLLADRSLNRERLVSLDFLGAPAGFPSSTFRLLLLLQTPVVLMFGLYRGGKRYEVHFEAFTPPVVMPGQPRAEALEGAMRAYVARLAHYCRLAPYNWFNFYDFWQ